MAPKNRDRANAGLDILLPVLVRYEVHELAVRYGAARWWEEGVDPVLSAQQRRDAAYATTDEQRIGHLDLALALGLIDWRWQEVFRDKLPRDARSWAHELKGARNDLSHHGVADIEQSRAARILETAQLLCEAMDAEAAHKIGALVQELRYGGAAAPARKKRTATTATLSVGDLPSWRQVAVPHADVAAGTLRKAEFAADLNQVVRGRAAAEYQDPRQFFARTYMTAGMEGLLRQALERVSGAGGEPVIQLKTAFGGGKTHSMLALYHLLTGGEAVAEEPSVRRVLDSCGLARVPRVNVAVVVGVAQNPARARRPSDMGGITVNTLWGDIAYQLCRNAGRPELYRLVKAADAKHVSPGSTALTQLFDACGPCLVLIDELVAYAKKLYGVEGLPAGSFDNLITFIQELTEAARASQASLVVASIPESEREIGGDAGQRALHEIEHTFGRMESIWKPVTSDEGFAVVSRRLFSDTVDAAAREKVCQAFFQMYQEHPEDYPVETRDARYLERLRNCYPIHPEVYDRLYEDWATIDGFQRTRGVLRFMAQVIHELWSEGDAMPLIMVGGLPFDEEKVRDELTRYLGDTWNTVVEAEVDGPNSEPVARDAANTRYGAVFASRRVARAVFLGSAPDRSSQTARGIDVQQLNLAVVSPGENPALFLDALSTLRGRASYLYADSANLRYWYDTQPNLRRAAEGRAQGMRDAEADAHICDQLRRWRALAPLTGLHACPASSLDVADQQGVRLVVLGPDAPHVRNDDGSAALARARDILANRGAAARRYRNALVFLAADAGKLGGLRQEVKRLLAWRSIQADTDALDLTQSAEREVAASIEAAQHNVAALLDEAYCWLMFPSQDLNFGGGRESWESLKPGGAGGAVERCAARLRSDGAIVDQWAPRLLQLQLDQWFWAEDGYVQIGELWDQLNRYCYLPRVASYDVLEAAIREGLRSQEFFGIAADVEGAGAERRFVDLHLGDGAAFIHPESLLVRVDVARAQLAAEAAVRANEVAGEALRQDGGGSAPVPGLGPGIGGRGGAPAEDGDEAAPPMAVRPHRFELSCDIDPLHANRDMQQLIDEVVKVLEQADDTEIVLTLDMVASSAAGFPRGVERAVSENCTTLGLSGAFGSRY